MQTITIDISQHEEYILLVELLQKFKSIRIREKVSNKKQNMAQYYGCLAQKQSIEEIDNQLQLMRNEWERDIC